MHLLKNKNYVHLNAWFLRSTGRDRSWTGDYAACGRCHLVRAAMIPARSLLAPESWREYPAQTSLVSPPYTGVVSRHARATLSTLSLWSNLALIFNWIYALNTYIPNQMVMSLTLTVPCLVNLIDLIYYIQGLILPALKIPILNPFMAINK